MSQRTGPAKAGRAVNPDKFGSDRGGQVHWPGIATDHNIATGHQTCCSRNVMHAAMVFYPILQERIQPVYQPGGQLLFISAAKQQNFGAWLHQKPVDCGLIRLQEPGPVASLASHTGDNANPDFSGRFGRLYPVRQPQRRHQDRHGWQFEEPPERLIEIDRGMTPFQMTLRQAFFTDFLLAVERLSLGQCQLRE